MAHISGNVILLVQFSLDGSVSDIAIISGPVMLRDNAISFVKGWQANPYTGPRTCPIVITYTLNTGSKSGPTDLQHYTVVGSEPPCLCDPPGVLGRKRRFL